MSQPWIIGVDDLTASEPVVSLRGCDIVAIIKWHEFRELIEQGQRIVEMIDGQRLKPQAEKDVTCSTQPKQS